MADVVVVGAGIGGLVCGALLARQGLRVLVLEKGGAVGGRGRSLRSGDFTIDYGAHLWCNQFLPAIRAAAGIDDYRPAPIPRAESLRIFAEGEGGRPFVYPGLDPSQSEAEITAAIHTIYGMTTESFTTLLGVIGQMLTLPDEEVSRLMPVSFRDWPGAAELAPEIAAGLARTIMLYGSIDPPSASVGEFVEMLRWGANEGAGAEYAGDNAEGGMQALMNAFVRRIEGGGGEVRTETLVERIVIENERVTGVIARPVHGLPDFFPCRRVVSNVPIWDLFAIADERLFPADYVRRARHYAAAVGETINVAFAFERPPRLRVTGEADRFRGWTRILLGSERRFGGGMVWTSLSSPAAAPQGKAILQAMRLVPKGTRGNAAIVAETIASFERMLDEIYLDATATLAFSRSWTTADSTDWLISAVPRPGVQAPGIAGLYVVGETTDVPGIEFDKAANSGWVCAQKIFEELRTEGSRASEARAGSTNRNGR